ncbi:hypothetical protein LTR37_010501 [Vermiconidia calcicola]|uniref:Uncharacterized protein n=1 Tax=Vermiconidia calcicola TaxID=1690605 RepID=A0ACC3N4Q3_9PEZI|nr:hypothetical protein LTR37_010501 [Vermiconidia calcicola]
MERMFGFDDRTGTVSHLTKLLPVGTGSLPKIQIQRHGFFDLKKLPPELRNRIFQYAVLEDHDIDISQYRALPRVAHVCKQLRDEVTPVYFGNNNFIVAIQGSKYQHLLHWLEKAAGQFRKTIPRLAIHCETGPFEDIFARPDLKPWHHLSYSLSALGLKAAQLRWPPGFKRKIENVSPALGHYVAERVLFNTYCLKPLLTVHNLWEELSLSTTVVCMVEEAFGSSATQDQKQRIIFYAQHSYDADRKLAEQWYSDYTLVLLEEEAALELERETACEAKAMWKQRNGAIFTNGSIDPSIIKDVAERLDVARDECRLERIAEAKEAHDLAVSTTHQDMVDDGLAVGNPRSFEDEGAESGAEDVEDDPDANGAVGDVASADGSNAENAALVVAPENVVALSPADEKAKERAELKAEYLRQKQAYKLEQDRFRAEQKAAKARIKARIAQRVAALADIDLKRFSMQK